MNIELWQNIELKGESVKKDMYAHHFTDFSHQDSREGPLASILSIERVCVMILNKTSFISASQRILLGHMVFKHSQNCVHRGYGYGGKLSELRKEGSRKEKGNISSFIVKGCPQVSTGWALGPTTGPMWITHERATDIPVWNLKGVAVIDKGMKSV
jgi:hypothetical protein